MNKTENNKIINRLLASSNFLPEKYDDATPIRLDPFPFILKGKVRKYGYVFSKAGNITER